MSHDTPNIITGKIVIGDILNATGVLNVETDGCIEKAEVLSNKNNTLLLEVKIHERDTAMLCFAQIEDMDANNNSGKIDVVIKEEIAITTFIIQLKSYNVVSKNINLQLLFIKSCLG